MSSEVSSKFNQIRQLHPSNLTDQEIYNILEQCQFNVAKAILQVMIREKQILSSETDQTTTQTNSNDSPFAALLAMNNEKKTKVPRVIATESFTITNHEQDDFEEKDCEDDSASQSFHEDEGEDQKVDEEDPKFVSTLNSSHFDAPKSLRKHTSNNQSSIRDFLHNNIDNESCPQSRKRKKCTKFLSDFWQSDEEDNLDDVDDDDVDDDDDNQSTTQKKTKHFKEEPNSLHTPTSPSNVENEMKPFKRRQLKFLSFKKHNPHRNKQSNK